MAGLLFGTAGTPKSTEIKSTAGGIERAAELGLGCMEIEFVRGVYLDEESAREVAETASANNITLSVHAPFYINLNAREPEKVRASRERILQSARTGAVCGARSVVVHTAFYLGDPPDEAYPKIKQRLKEILDRLQQEGIAVTVRPEVMGKGTQFGTVEEVIRLCSELVGTAPCIDFAHCHAATGAFNTYPEFVSILEQIEAGLGRAALDDMHIHASGIRYGKKGEQKHLNLKESDFNYRDLLSALKDFEVNGLLVCESPNLEEDALLMQRYYHHL